MSRAPLTFSVKMCPQINVKSVARSVIDCRNLTPNALANLSAVQIAALRIKYNNQIVNLDSVFDIIGEDTQHVVFKSNDENFVLDYLGANMTTGEITIESNAGDYCGFNLQAGTIHCLKNTADFAACNMAGGLLKIDGNTGDFLGGASTGLRKGMRGGAVIVKGNAGDRVGDQMRRGLILIEGNVGDYCGSRMIAGTVGVLGTVGKYAGFSMQRGTLLFTNKPSLHATIHDCGMHTLPFLSLMFKSFAQYNTKFSLIKSQRVQRFVGDIGNNGNGEILLCIDSPI